MTPACPSVSSQPIAAGLRVTVGPVGDLGRMLMIAGGALLLLGALFTLGGRIPWLGRLPGDIAIERENFRFYFPLGTSILLSILLSLVAWLFRR
jgi:membrane protein implicated in regulation of membrane protease activity